jgi:hypothetical protein
VRLAARKDANHDPIASAFRGLGCSWWDTFRLGAGFPDGVAGYQGVNVLVEIKGEDGELTDEQQAFFNIWRGWAAIVRRVEDVPLIVREMRLTAEARRRKIRCNLKKKS